MFIWFRKTNLLLFLSVAEVKIYNVAVVYHLTVVLVIPLFTSTNVQVNAHLCVKKKRKT